MTILENNCVQSIATAAGYMTMPLTSGLAAYMWATNNVLPAWQILCFTIVLSILGVLVAFPMKRRFINDEQHPFPEGRACGVVLDALYEKSAAAAGMFKARALAAAAALSGTFGLISGENYMKLLQERWLGFQSSWHFPTHLDGWYYSLVDKGLAPLPKLAGVDIRQLALSPTHRLRNDRRRRPDGHPHRREPADRRGAQLRDRGTHHDRGRRDHAACRIHRRGHGDLRPGPHPELVGALVGHHHDGGRRDGGSFRPPRGVRRGVPQPDRADGRADTGDGHAEAHRIAAARLLDRRAHRRRRGRVDGARLVRRGLGARCRRRFH